MSISGNAPYKKGDWIDNIDRQIMPFVEYGEYADRYPANDICVLTKGRVEELRRVSEILFDVFQKAVNICQYCNDDILMDMEIPQNLIQYLHQTNKLHIPTWLSRFDYVMDKDANLKMVEINADTPCAVVEAYYANEIACNHFGYVNPNAHSVEGLQKWLSQIYWESSPEVNLANGDISANSPFVFSCFDDYIEDYGTTMYLMNAMKKGVGPVVGENAICFESFYKLGMDEDNNIVLPDGRHAKGIYRLHPMELLIDEVTEDGESLGEMFMDGYKNGRFTMFNPPEAIIMQSKGFQALIWALVNEKPELFSDIERKTVLDYMLPSYFEWQENTECNWICKPLWGREGMDISVYDCNGDELMAKEVENPDDVVRRESEKYMYQKFVEQAESTVRTDSGLTKGYNTFSCFMHGTKPGAVYARFSPEQIAGTEAYWLPIGVRC